MRKKKPIETALVIGDMHDGSRFGLAPPSWWSKRTQFMSEWLWKCWMHMIDWLPPEIDLLVLNGDLIEGQQKRGDSVGLYTADLSEQTDMAIETLEPLAKKCKRIIRVGGTAYHEGFHGNLKALDKHFGIDCPKDPRDHISRYIKLADGAVMHVAHHPGGGSTLYKGTNMDRELLWSKIAAKCHAIPDANILIRNHLHFYGCLADAQKMIIQNPCWQWQTAWAQSKNEYRWLPDIGCVLLKYNEDMPQKYMQIPNLYPNPERIVQEVTQL
jgi:hypothetical protein